MTVSEYINKYGKGKFDKYPFFDDLYSDFIQITSSQHVTNYSGFLNAKRAIKIKYDAIAARLLGSYGDKLWASFVKEKLDIYALKHYTKEYNEELAAKRIKEEQQRQYAEREQQRRNRYKQSYQFGNAGENDFYQKLFEEMFNRFAKQNFTFNSGFEDFFNKQNNFGTRRSSINNIQASFSVLKLTMSATISDVKTAYRTLALQLHPDKGGDNDKFIALTNAKDACLAYLDK